MRRVLVGLWLALGVSAGCRLNPECFGANECTGDLICFRGSCIDPRVLPPDGGGVGPDTGVPPTDAGPAPDAFVPTYTWNDDIEAVVQRRCVECHSNPPQFGAPMSLATWLDTQQPAPLASGVVYEVMADRVTSVTSPMPPGGRIITGAEIEMLTTWAAEGAPFGDQAPPDSGVVDTGVDSGVVDTGVDAGFPDSGPPPGTDPTIGFGTPQQLTGPDQYVFLEGPAWDRTRNVLLFSDVLGQVIYQLDPNAGNQVTQFRTPSGQANGLFFADDGDLYVCEQGARQVTRTPGGGMQGASQPVAVNYQGQAFHSPNDVVVRADGTVYFTDPPYAQNPPQLTFNGLFRVTPQGNVVVEWQGAPASRPNGVNLSPDESVLYMTDSADGTVYRYDVRGDGSLANRRPFADAVGDTPDGLAVDVDGNVYLASGAGIEVFAPTGWPWGVIPVAVPGDNQLSNLVFGGADNRTLYMSAGVYVYSVQAALQGAR